MTIVRFSFSPTEIFRHDQTPVGVSLLRISRCSFGSPEYIYYCAAIIVTNAIVMFDKQRNYWKTVEYRAIMKGYSERKGDGGKFAKTAHFQTSFTAFLRTYPGTKKKCWKKRNEAARIKWGEKIRRSAIIAIELWLVLSYVCYDIVRVGISICFFIFYG